MFGDDATIEILLKWKQENEYVVAQVQAALAALGTQTVATNTATQAMNLTGAPGWAQVAIAIAAVAAALMSFTLLVGSAAIALISFTVAGAGMLTLFGGVALGFGILTAALFMADVAGKQVDNGWATLKANALGFASTLTAQAAPAIGLVIGFLNSLIAPAAQAASSIITWWGERVPGVLAGLSKMIKDLSPDFVAFGQYVGGVMDQVGPKLQLIFEAMVRLGLQGARGLLDNLLRLSDWFIKELPTLGPIVQQTMGKMGDIIQWVAREWAILTDFVSKNWDTTVKNAQAALRELATWWEKNGKTVTEFTGNLRDLMSALTPLIVAWTTLYNFLNGVGLSPTKLLEALNSIVGALQATWNLVQQITNTKLPTGGAAAHAHDRYANAPAAQQSSQFNTTISGGAGSSDTTNSLLQQAVDHLGTIAGATPASAALAARRYG